MDGWDGTVLEECSEMPEDTLKGPAETGRRLLEAGTYGDMDCDEDSCVKPFEQCAGGYNMTQACCDPATQCTIKNWYVPQLLLQLGTYACTCQGMPVLIPCLHGLQM